MPSTRARMLPLALVLATVAVAASAAACGHKSAPTSESPTSEPPPDHAAADAASPTVPTEPAPAEPAQDLAQDTAIPTGEKTAAGNQQVTFDDDADPEPTTQIQGAPKRPPMPRFKLFGTREGDGPN